MSNLKKHIKTTLKEFVAKVIKEELENDTYASFKGVKPYKERMLDFKNSIKTFHDLDDDKILKHLNALLNIIQ